MGEKILVAIFCVLLVSSTISFADSRPDGNKLFTQCGKAVAMMDATEESGQRFSPEDYVQASFCLGYLSGFLDMHALYQVTAGNRVAFCVPSGVLSGHAARVVVQYLHEHAEKLHEDSVTLIILALKEAFPCSPS
jgi:hypothetical protein